MCAMDDIIIIGYGGHAKSVCDTIERAKIYHIIGYTDSYDKNVEYSYLGNDDVLPRYFQKVIKYVAMGIGYLGRGRQREKIYTDMKKVGFFFPVLIDPSAIIADTCSIGEGTFIGKNVTVNSETCIGKLCIINTGAIIEHDCTIGDFAHISVGTIICGGVKIARESFVGANATIIQNITIGEKTIVGAGAVVVGDCLENKCIKGNPAN